MKNIMDLTVKEVFEKLAELIGTGTAALSAAPEEESVPEVDMNRILPTQDEVKTMDLAEVKSNLKEVLGDEAEIKGSDSALRKVLAIIIAEVEGDEIDTDQVGLKKLAEMLGVKPAKAMAALQERLAEIRQEPGDAEETAEEEASEEGVSIDVGSRVSVEIDGETYEGEVIEMMDETGQVKFDDGEVLDIPYEEMTLLDEDGESEEEVEEEDEDAEESEESEDENAKDAEEEPIGYVTPAMWNRVAQDYADDYDENQAADDIAKFTEEIVEGADMDVYDEDDQEKIAALVGYLNDEEIDLQDRWSVLNSLFLQDDAEGSDAWFEWEVPGIVDGMVVCSGMPVIQVDEEGAKFVATADGGDISEGDTVTVGKDEVTVIYSPATRQHFILTGDNEFIPAKNGKKAEKKPIVKKTVKKTAKKTAKK